MERLLYKQIKFYELIQIIWQLVNKCYSKIYFQKSIFIRK